MTTTMIKEYLIILLAHTVEGNTIDVSRYRQHVMCRRILHSLNTKFNPQLFPILPYVQYVRSALILSRVLHDSTQIFRIKTCAIEKLITGSLVVSAD